MTKEIKLSRPGIALRRRTARKLKHGYVCGRLYYSEANLSDRKTSWRKFNQLMCEGCSQVPLKSQSNKAYTMALWQMEVAISYQWRGCGVKGLSRVTPLP